MISLTSMVSCVDDPEHDSWLDETVVGVEGWMSMVEVDDIALPSASSLTILSSRTTYQLSMMNLNQERNRVAKRPPCLDKALASYGTDLKKTKVFSVVIETPITY